MARQFEVATEEEDPIDFGGSELVVLVVLGNGTVVTVVEVAAVGAVEAVAAGEPTRTTLETANQFERNPSAAAKVAPETVTVE